MQTSQPSRSLKEKHRQERESLILQVAEEVLLEKGYYDTSMDEIASRVGIAKGTVYLHFPGKEELVVAIFESDMQRFLQGFDTAIASAQTACDKLEALILFMYVGIFSKRAQLLSTILHSVDMRRVFAEKGSCMRTLWDNLSDRVTLIIEDGKAAGEIDAAIPTYIMLGAFFSLLSPKNYQRLIHGDQITPEELVHYVARVFFKGILAP